MVDISSLTLIKSSIIIIASCKFLSSAFAVKFEPGNNFRIELKGEKNDGLSSSQNEIKLLPLENLNLHFFITMFQFTAINYIRNVISGCTAEHRIQIF